MMARVWVNRFAAVTVAILFFGCGESDAPARRSARAPAPAAPSADVSTGSTAEVPSPFSFKPDDYSYIPAGKRDPFKKFTGEIEVQTVEAPRTPLERYGLDQLSITAIIWGIADPRALIRAPDGYSYIVKKNVRIGKNRGRVSRITRREVFVEEEYRDPTGKLIVRESVLEIRAKEEDEKKNKKLMVRFSDE